MIVNIRGTSGSGKSTLVRELMRCYQKKVAIYKLQPDPGKTKARKQPICYWLSRGQAEDGQLRPLVVLGHYETACGGCDTISSLDEIFSLAETSAKQGNDVVFEGLLISADVQRTVALSKLHPIKVLALNVPLDVCLDSVNGRRRERMGEKFTGVNPKNTTSKHRGVMLSVERLRAAGVDAGLYTRDEALAAAKRELGL